MLGDLATGADWAHETRPLVRLSVLSYEAGVRVPVG